MTEPARVADDGSDPQNREDLKAWGIESDDGTLSEVVYKKEQDNRGLKEESAPDEGGRRGAPVSFPGVASLDRRKACSENRFPRYPKKRELRSAIKIWTRYRMMPAKALQKRR